MKYRRMSGTASLRVVWGTPAFYFLTAVFLCGAAAGSLTGLRSAQISGALVNDLADAVLAAGEGTALPGLVRDSIVPALVWPAAVLLCGALRGYSLWISALLAVRGFLFAFAVGVMLVARGTAGIALSAVSCASGGVLTLPALLLIATMSFSAALDRPARSGGYLYALGRFRTGLFFSLAASLLGGCVRILAVVCAAQYGAF